MMKIKRYFGFLRLGLLFGWFSYKNEFKRILKELVNIRTLILFLFVIVVMSSEIWLPYIIGIITNNAWLISIASACWLFWLGPATPFLPLCVAITLGIKKIWKRANKQSY